MSKHILLLTIGPVQDFIAHARKTRDLAAGSRILSKLIGDARHFLESSDTTMVIFPNKKILTPPNRLLALIDDKQLEIVRKIEENGDCGLEKYLKDRLKRIATESIGTTLSKEAYLQIAACLKVYWVSLPYFEENYKSDYKKLDCLLGALKHTRQIIAVNEKGRKCDVDGNYNVQYYRMQNKKEKDRGEAWVKRKKLFSNENTVMGNNFAHFSMRELPPGEGLSAVSMMKRKYELGKEGDFYSTAEFALMDPLNRLEESEKPELKAAISCLRRTNSQLFFEENLLPNTFKKISLENNLKIERKEVKDWQRKVKNAAKRHTPRLELTKYYSILLFDIDNMGKILSGKWLKNGTNLLGFQEQLSECMAKFSKEVRELVDSKNSRTVYAGGDDFLGFINLNDLLPILGEVRIKFKKMVHEKLSKSLDQEKEITFSAGVAIAHYKMPLSIVLDAARKTEKLAKDKKDKNALGITVLKKSGEMEQSIWSWNSNTQTENAPYITTTFQELIKMLHDRVISNAYIAAFNRLFCPMINEDGNLGKADEGVLMGEIVNTELKRLMIRAKVNGKEEDIEKMADTLAGLYKMDNQIPLSNFTAMLNITDFISRHINQEKVEA